MPSHFITALLQQATAQGSRSTVLRPLGWLAAICVSGLFGCLEFKAPSWITTLFAGMTALVVFLYLASYLYCLFNDREALRSETYSIQKLAIEKGFVGDNTTGLFPEQEVTMRES
jgi:hypothetical protein